MLRKLLFTAFAASLQVVAVAQTTPDWATQVAPILYNNCTACHHDGGIAPFSLLTYSDAVLNSGSILAAVPIGKMPPWMPDPTYSRLAHQRILTPTEISTIVNWVNGGTPEGNPALAPPLPSYPNTGMIPGTPGLSVKIPTFTSYASATQDVYQCFVIPSHLATDAYISSFEAIPGNPACVHHVLVYADTTGVCASLQAASVAAGTGPGYEEFGGAGTTAANMLGVWVPGSAPMSYPSGFGLRIPKNADIVVQVHYPAGTGGMVDSTQVHFYFAPPAGIRQVYMEPVLYHGDSTGSGGDMLNGPLYIPADTVKTFYEEFPPVLLNADMTMIGVFPHMHLIGHNIESYIVHPAGDTDKLVRINNWDFHWQGFYMFPQLKKVPAGSAVRADATYNNTSSNLENPYSPPQNIYVGENTTNEMMIVFFVYAAYQAGDENIIVDSTLLAIPTTQFQNYYHGEQLLDVYPNPASSDLIVKCYFEDPDVGSMDLVDMEGRVVREFVKDTKLGSGYNAYTYSVSGLAAGTYTLVIRTTENVMSQKVVVVH